MANHLLDFLKKKEEKVENRKREFERILFKNFLGAYSVMNDGEVIYPINLVNISRGGCLINFPWNQGKFPELSVEQEIAIRIYFTKDTYIPVNLVVKRVEQVTDKQTTLPVLECGCSFDETYGSFAAMRHFIDFLYSYAEHSKFDRGDNKIFFL